MNRQQRGFTLIEILVVIALTTLLAAILFPVFAQAREKARQSACLSNLRQLATSMHLYSEDYDDALPLVLSHRLEEPIGLASTWMARLQPYLHNVRVCLDPPSDRLPLEVHASGAVLASYAYPPSYRARGYAGLMVTAPPFGTAMWEGLGGFEGAPIGDYHQAAPSLCRSQVARPAETILICDHRVFDWGLTAKKLYYPSPRHLREPDLKLPNGGTAPQGRINAAFVDGHIKALRHEQFWAILPDYSRLGRPTRNVFRHFWPYE